MENIALYSLQILYILYYARKSVTTMWKCGNTFSRVYKSIQNSQSLHYFLFDIFQYFTTTLHNFTKLRKLFPIVLKLFSNLKVCLIGEWSIDKQIASKIKRQKVRPGMLDMSYLCCDLFCSRINCQNVYNLPAFALSHRLAREGTSLSGRTRTDTYKTRAWSG